MAASEIATAERNARIMDPLQESKKFTHEGSDVAGLMAQEGDMKDRFAHVATQNPSDLRACALAGLKYHASGGGGEKEAREFEHMHMLYRTY